MSEARILRADSATALDADFLDAVLVCGSHGGLFPGSLALGAGCRAVVFHDAGGGRDNAGVASLEVLAAFGVPAVAVAHWSARVGDADDMWARGVVSTVNAVAAALGCSAGATAAAAARAMTRAQPGIVRSAGIEEQRVLVAQSRALKAWALDSASQVTADDAGMILLTGSHGGLLGGRPAAALRANARLAIFNDAGVGIDDAGIGRLKALEERGVAAATVASDSALIGDGVSTYEDGVISFLNEPARRLGAGTGMPARALVTLVLEGDPRGASS